MKKMTFWILLLSLLSFTSTLYATPYFMNAGFEDPGLLSNWTSSGIVSQASSATVTFDIYTYNISPQEGNSMALLSAPGLSGGGYYTNNLISQTIDSFSGGSISFYYNIFSTDWNQFDRFTVYIDAANDLYDYCWDTDEYAADIPIVQDEFYYSDWKLFSYNPGAYTGSLTITLGAGNGVDDTFNTWVYVDNFLPKSLVPIPEPGTWLLFSLGLSIVLGFGKKFFKIQ